VDEELQPPPETAPSSEYAKDRVPLLEVDNVTLRFGGVVALNQVNFTLYEHEILGLIGPNGAGKTTALKAILGLTDF